LSGLIGAMAAPMIFEFPFDLIIMTRVYPPIPPDPSLYRALFFAPGILIEVLILSLLSFVPTVRLTRPALFCFALMLLVFAAWALAGFGFPATAGSYAFNVVGKLIAFVTTLTLFVPSRKPSTLPAAQGDQHVPVG
jgi:peptidoglycan/LPS O-acetylase OafA/YrhL